MQRQGAYYRLYEAQARQSEADRVAMAAMAIQETP
jgi:hypothetical protein